jgi:hypothetical protein
MLLLFELLFIFSKNKEKKVFSSHLTLAIKDQQLEILFNLSKKIIRPVIKKTKDNRTRSLVGEKECSKHVFHKITSFLVIKVEN